MASPAAVFDYTESVSIKMLKKSIFSPARPLRAETRFPPGGVLALLRGSTYRMQISEVGALEGLFRSPRFILGANSPHEVRSVPPRLFARCGLAVRPF